MGIFRPNYNREGPGVSKEQAEKRRFFLFFDLLFRKSGRLIQANLLYFVTLLPTILGLVLFLFGQRLFGGVLYMLSALIVGPATAAFTYILRNYAMQRHAWLLSDFFEQFKKNYKQGVIMGVLDLIIPVVAYVSFFYYRTIAQGPFAYVGLGATLLLIMIFAILNFYAYPIMVTFQLKFSEIFKNAIIFTLAKFPLNVLILIVDAAICYGILRLNVYLDLFVILPFFAFSLIGFINVFAAWGGIAALMLPEEEDDGESSLFSDERIQ